MKKQKILKIVNMFLFIAFLFTMLSIIIYKIIPSPLQGDETIGMIHGYSGIFFFFIGLIHLVLNWQWVKTQYFNKKGVKK